MKYYHTKCKGIIDPKTRTCEGCGKRWNPVSFLLTPTSIRVVPGTSTIISRKPGDRALRVNRKLTTQDVVKKLPNWPRWARVLTVVVLLAIVVTIIVLLRR